MLPPVASSGVKIKGGRWTVFRFFVVSVAYTAVWLALSSELGYYKHLYGPQVLLQLNIAYYAPSIPLLLFQSLFDEALEARLGVARTILYRLVAGLFAYGAICAWLPFMPQSLWCLLAAVVCLGACSGLAFSASYQLVARFANKSVISLGIGCSASGPIVLALQLALRLGQHPTRRQHILLYETIAAIVACGLWATASLLIRHWDAIDASAQRQDEGPEELHEALLPEGAAGREEAGLSPAPPSSPPALRRLSQGGGTIFRQPSLPPLIAYSQLEPYHTYLSEETEWPAHNGWPRQRLSSASGSGRDRSGHGGTQAGLLLGGSGSAVEDGGGGERLQRSPSLPLPTLERISAHKVTPAAAAAAVVHAGDGVDVAASDHPFRGGVESEDEGAEGGGAGMLATVRLIWPAMVALALQGGVALTLFPFFTYVPSSGLLGDDLPRVLFFGRILADVAGRTLPRLAALRPSSIRPVLAVALAHLAAAPLFFLYLKGPPAYRSDAGAMAYVAALWCASGYVNTGANMCAPAMVPPQLKSSAAGLMAMTYQAGHVAALALATVLTALMFGFGGGGVPAAP